MSDSEGELGLFEEPEGYYQAEKEPTFVTYTLLDGRELNLRLVGHNPLWVGHRHPHPLRGISLDPHVCDQSSANVAKSLCFRFSHHKIARQPDANRTDYYAVLSHRILENMGEGALPGKAHDFEDCTIAEVSRSINGMDPGSQYKACSNLALLVCLII